MPPALFLLSALALILIYPGAGMSLFAPFALTPIVIGIAREPSAKRRALYAWAAGFLYWSGACYWIHGVLAQYASMPLPLVWLAFVLFAILRSLHWAVFGWLAGYLVHSRWAVLTIAALWTGLERCYGPFGFAWLVLGNAGIDMGVPMRLAPITGVYGLSFVLAMMGTGVALLMMRRPRAHLLPLALLAALYLLPALPEGGKGPESAGVESAIVVQPNIVEHSNWTRQELEDTIRRMAMASLDIGLKAKQQPKMILWPEVPAPFYDTDPHIREQVALLARTVKSDVLLGLVHHEPSGETRNSAFQIGADGNPGVRYDKVNLVPFGEHTPSLFAWVGQVTSEAGGFQPGDHIVNFPIGNFKAGVFICYESVFPHYVREYAASGAGVLVNLSNDGYFGKTAAREQHLLLARMRAAENRRWLLRATNDGITATINPAGEVMHRLTPFRQSAARTNFSLRSDVTLYTKWGDWFVWSCLVIGVVSAGMEAFFRQKE
ncbi:MAG: apolipoprotein N-acyltransferase [Acidobacteria bacterium]|nr:apolipoprotein N-acyltransferase [Acidobacteriota bacterium]